MFHVRDDHPPIVSDEIWEKAQEIMAESKYRKIAKELKNNDKYEYTGLLFCSKCRAVLRRRVWNSNKPFEKYVWQCSNYVNKSKRTCTGTRIDEKELEKVNINGPTIIREELRDGKKYYSYTSKGK